MICKNWEVGSTWYNYVNLISSCEEKDIKYPIFQSSVTYLSTCRSAIRAIINATNISGNILVPAFTCHSVVEPFIEKEITVWGYQLNKDLSVNWDTLIEQINFLNPSAILLHGYFGFDTLSNGIEIIENFRRNGVIIIEDQTQNLFSKIERIPADFRIGSIRKWFPIPDGAFIKGLKITGLKEDKKLLEAKLKALKAKSNYIFNGIGTKANFSNLHSKAEQILDSRTEIHSISSDSLEFLQKTKLSDCNKQRQTNYTTLINRLSLHNDIKIIRPKLNPDEVPFLIPVYIPDNRLGFQQFMAANNVYPTIIWSCPDVLKDKIDSNSQYIYNNILCFHCDQRYDINDMNQVGDIVDSYFK